MDVNLNSVMRLSMAARPLLARSKGAIVNFASMLSYVVDDAVPAYSASKTGLLGSDPHARASLRTRGHSRERDRAGLS